MLQSRNETWRLFWWIIMALLGNINKAAGPLSSRQQSWELRNDHSSHHHWYKQGKCLLTVQCGSYNYATSWHHHEKGENLVISTQNQYLFLIGKILIVLQLWWFKAKSTFALKNVFIKLRICKSKKWRSLLINSFWVGYLFMGVGVWHLDGL